MLGSEGAVQVSSGRLIKLLMDLCVFCFGLIYFRRYVYYLQLYRRKKALIYKVS